MFRLPLGSGQSTCALTLAFCSLVAAAPSPTPAAALLSLPLVFEQQQDSHYLARAGRYALLLGDGQVQFSAPGRTPITMTLAGSEKGATLSGEQLQTSYSNYYFGRDPQQWRTHVPHYGQVRCRSVYPGIDLVFHGTGRQLEYDFVLAPGADPNRIALSFAGVRSLRVENGDLLLQAQDGGELRQMAPVVYQEIDGQRKPVNGRYVRKSNGQIGFVLARYDRAKPLVIDPLLSYATYLGGSSNDYGRAVAVDGTGSVYIAGKTMSANFPATGNPTKAPDSGGDAFVVKLNPGSSSLAYSTYFGGTNSEDARALALDGSGNAYVTGTTTSTNFPTTAGAYKTTATIPQTDSFVVKLTASGQIAYATYLAGNGSNPTATAIAADATGRAFVAGTAGYYYSSSAVYPTTASAYQTSSKGTIDGFVTVLNPSGSAAVYSTLLGGTGVDGIYSLVLDASGNAIVAGYTAPNTSTTPATVDFPVTSGVVQSTAGGNTDAFVTGLNSTGTGLLFSTLLGGTQNDYAYALALDGSGNIYVTGYTSSSDFPTTPAAYQTLAGSGFVAKLNSTATSLIYSTYFGPAGYSSCSSSYPDTVHGCEGGNSIAVDSSGNAYVVGATARTNFPTTPGALQTATGNTYYYTPDAFFLRLNPAGNFVDYSTLYGGSNTEYGEGVALDSAGNVYLVGTTSSSNLPVTSDAYQSANGTPVSSTNSSAYYDAFLAKISMQPGSCSYTVQPNTLALPATAISGSINVTAPAGCPWSGYISNSYYSTFLTLTSTNGVGSGALNYTATQNYSNSPRSLTLSVAGQTVSVNQAAMACTYTIVPTSIDVPATGGVGNVRLYTPSGCTWSVSSNASWVTVTSVSSNSGSSNGVTTGSGDGSVQYSVQANNTSVSRTATITIGGQSFTITQAAPGCTYTLSAGSASLGSGAGTGSVTVTTGTGCAFGVSSSASWLATDVTSGTGTTTINYTATANTTTSARTAIVTIGGQTFSVTQAAPTVNGTLTTTSPDSALYNSYSAFTVALGSTTMLTRNISLAATPSGAVSYTSAVSGSPQFLTVSPQTGTTPATVTLTANPQGLGAGTYTNTVTFTGGGSTAVYTVVLTVQAGNTGAKVGIYRSSGLVLLDRNGDGTCCSGDVVATYGQSGDIILTGDWTGSGVKKLGLYRRSTGQFILDLNNNGLVDGPDRNIALAPQTGDIPVVGDWTGTGVERAGVFRNGTWYLDVNGDGTFSGRAYLGQSGDIPLVGNWNGVGTTSKVGIYRPNAMNGQPGNFFLVDSNGDGQYTSADLPLFFLGQQGDVPIIGDWSGDGKTKVGIFRPAGAATNPGLFILDQNGNFAWDGPGTDKALYFAPYLTGPGTSTMIQAGDIPITGNWVPSYTPSAAGTAIGQGKTRTGIYRPGTGTFFLDATADGTYQGRAFLGQAGDIPVGVPLISSGAVVGVNGLGNY